MNFLSAALLLLVFCLPLNLVIAQSIVPPGIVSMLSKERYQCDLTAWQDDQFIERSFTIKPKTNSAVGHGGQEFEFSEGQHRIVVTADRNWLGLSWYYNEVFLAEAVNVQTGVSRHRVLIVLDPNGPDNQAHLSCNKLDPKESSSN